MSWLPVAPKSRRRKKKEGKKITMGSPGDVVGRHWGTGGGEDRGSGEKGKGF